MLKVNLLSLVVRACTTDQSCIKRIRHKNCNCTGTPIIDVALFSSFLVRPSHGGSAGALIKTVGLAVSDQTCPLDTVGNDVPPCLLGWIGERVVPIGNGTGADTFCVGRVVKVTTLLLHSTSSANVHISSSESNKRPSPQSYLLPCTPSSHQ